MPLTPLLSRLSAATLVVLLTALLCERSIVFVARSLPVLSACVHAAAALVFPLEWPVCARGARLLVLLL